MSRMIDSGVFEVLQMKRFFQHAALTAIVCLTASVWCWPQNKIVQLRTDYDATKTALKVHFDGFGIDDSAKAPNWLDREWTLIGEWAVEYLNAHPSVTADEVKASVQKLDSDLDVNVLELSQKTYVIATRQGEMGNVFLVAGRGEEFRVPWNIKRSNQNDLQQTGLLAAWSAEGASSDYWSVKTKKDWGQCGPFFGGAEKLPDNSDGHSRFYIDATRAQPAGATVGAQLSVWEWDGKTARPLFVRTYAYMIDQAQGTRFDGEYLRIREKDFFRTFFSCGGCEEPQKDWTIHISRDGIEDLGKKSVVPELDAIDELYYRIEHRMPTAQLAAPHV